MESLLNAALVLPQWVVFVVVVVVLFVFVLGSTIGSSIIGFGPRVVRRTETFEYGEEEAKNRAPEKQGQPNKRSITTVGLTRFREPIRVKRSSSVKGVEIDGKERKALLA